MKAIIFTGTALKHSTEVRLEVGFDSTGPYIATDGVQMTSDDIMASEHFMVADIRGSGFRKRAANRGRRARRRSRAPGRRAR